MSDYDDKKDTIVRYDYLITSLSILPFNEIKIPSFFPERVAKIIFFFVYYRSLALVSSKNRDAFISTESCDEMGNRLNRRQVEFCKKNIIVMNSIKTGAVEAVSECQHQFRHRRWNCTTMHFDKSPVFGNSANGGKIKKLRA